jgi:hypothetical protein
MANIEPVRLVEDEETGDRFLIYADKGGIRVELRYEGETLWLSQAQMAELFGVTRASINIHLKNIYEDNELAAEATCKESLQVREEGGRRVKRSIPLYNLDAIISVGYRVGSKQGTLFRRWATEKLVQFATKGWVIDERRLREPGRQDHFAELRKLIQDIRASEANVYAELRRILSICQDYDPNTKASQNFFAHFQNKLHYTVTSHTAAEIKRMRANASEPNMGLTNWSGEEIRQSDVTVAKNYLGQTEIEDLNRATNMLLDYFEDQTERRRLVSLADAEQKLDEWLKFNERPQLRGFGSVTAKQADDHAKAEFKKFDGTRRLERKRQADEGLVHALDAQVKVLTRPSRRKKKT